MTVHHFPVPSVTVDASLQHKNSCIQPKERNRVPLQCQKDVQKEASQALHQQLSGSAKKPFLRESLGKYRV